MPESSSQTTSALVLSAGRGGGSWRPEVILPRARPIKPLYPAVKPAGAPRRWRGALARGQRSARLIISPAGGDLYTQARAHCKCGVTYHHMKEPELDTKASSEKAAVQAFSTSEQAASAEPTLPAVDAAPAALLDGVTPIDILLAEDDDDLREAVTDTLQDAGYTTVSFANGQEALEWLQDTPRLPSLVLIDMRMPVMDGWQFREKQSKDPAIAAVPVVMLSAMNEVGKGVGVEHLKKPVQPGELLAVVARHCGRRSEPSGGGAR
jgi:CheY-like chemotaxis protein